MELNRFSRTGIIIRLLTGFNMFVIRRIDLFDYFDSGFDGGHESPHVLEQIPSGGLVTESRQNKGLPQSFFFVEGRLVVLCRMCESDVLSVQYYIKYVGSNILVY